MVGVVREEKIINKLLQFRFVKEFHLSHEKKNELREQFYQILMKQSQSFIKCVVPAAIQM